MADREALIAEFLAATGWGDAERGLLADDASFRRYDRLRRGDDQAVLMDAPPPMEDVRPFIHIDRLLRGMGLSAPEILAEDIEAGLLLLEDLGDYSLLAVSPETGRTHQIRVHLAWLGVPVVGDRVYGPGRSARRAVTIMGLERQFLHAWRLSFEHPSGKGAVDLEAPLPPDLQQAINVLRG